MSPPPQLAKGGHIPRHSYLTITWTIHHLLPSQEPSSPQSAPSELPNIPTPHHLPLTPFHKRQHHLMSPLLRGWAASSSDSYNLYKSSPQPPLRHSVLNREEALFSHLRTDHGEFFVVYLLPQMVKNPPAMQETRVGP